MPLYVSKRDIPNPPRHPDAQNWSQQPKGPGRDWQRGNASDVHEPGYTPNEAKPGSAGRSHEWQRMMGGLREHKKLQAGNKGLILGTAGVIGAGSLAAGHGRRKELKQQNSALASKSWSEADPFLWHAPKSGALRNRHKVTVLGEQEKSKLGGSFAERHAGKITAGALTVPYAAQTAGLAHRNQKLKSGVAKFSGTPEHGRRYRDEPISKVNFTPTPVLRQTKPITFDDAKAEANPVGAQAAAQAAAAQTPGQPGAAGAKPPTAGTAGKPTTPAAKPMASASAATTSTAAGNGPKAKPMPVQKQSDSYVVPVHGGRPRNFDPEERRQRRLGAATAGTGLLGLAAGAAGATRLHGRAKALGMVRQGAMANKTRITAIPLDRRGLAGVGAGGVGLTVAGKINSYANDPRSRRRR